MKARTTLALIALTLSSCRTVEPDTIATLVVRFQKGAHAQYVRAVPPAVTSEDERFDVLLEDYGDFVGRVFLRCDGTRNLLHVGTGDEAAFRRLAKLKMPWNPRAVITAADKAGISPAERRGYWTPNGGMCELGKIVGVRDGHTGVGALLFIRSIGPGSLSLLIAHPRAE